MPERALRTVIVGYDGSSPSARALERALVGSTAEDVVRLAPCDVFVVRERRGPRKRWAAGY